MNIQEFKNALQAVNQILGEAIQANVIFTEFGFILCDVEGGIFCDSNETEIQFNKSFDDSSPIEEQIKNIALFAKNKFIENFPFLYENVYNLNGSLEEELKKHSNWVNIVLGDFLK
jgi:hypothetical protein